MGKFFIRVIHTEMTTLHGDFANGSAIQAGFDDEHRIRADLPDKLYKFLKRLLSLHPSDRPSTEEILESIRGGTTLEELGQHQDRPSVLSDLRHRISNLDSPAPTPPRRSSIQKLGVPPPQFKRPGSALRQSSPEQSPSRPSSPVRRDLNGSADGERAHVDAMLERSLSPRKRLALPPPPPPSTHSRFLNILAHPTTSLASRVCVFLFKIYTLTQSCTPYEAKWFIAYPLLALALLDFVGIPHPSREEVHQGASWRFSAILLVVHLGIVFFASRVGGLCAFHRWTA